MLFQLTNKPAQLDQVCDRRRVAGLIRETTTLLLPLDVTKQIGKYPSLANLNICKCLYPNPRIRLSVCVSVTKRPHLTHYPQANTLSAG